MASNEVDGESGSERRSHYRVPTRIPLRWRCVEPGEEAGLALEITAQADERPAPLDPGVAVALQELERKLDLVLAHLDSSRARPLGERDAQDVSLSGSGLGIELDAGIEPDDQVLVEFLLPGCPVRHVRALARPIFRPEGSGAKPLLGALAYEVISDDDRDAIVRFSHDVQRVELRNRASRRRPA